MLKNSTIILTSLLLISSLNIYSQKLIAVIDETFTVNSTSSMTGYTRNITQISLPEKTKSYIYRISIFPKGSSSVDNTLFDLLKKMGGVNVNLATSFAQFAVKNNDNFAVDAFIFSNTYDSDNFFSKKDGNWSACKTMNNRVSCCFSTDDCIGRNIYFGFRNNNMMQGVDVKLEVVAVIDSTMTSNFKSSYSILNSSNRELKYLISFDNKNWTETTLRNGYLQNLSFDQKEVFFKIYTNKYKFSAYKLTPNERYKIIYNQNSSKWDIVRY